jgi:hypothetical protein
MNDIVTLLSDPAVVSHKNQCLPIDPVYSAEKIHDISACFGVQIASGFISQNYRGIID